MSMTELARERRILELREWMHDLGIAADDWDDEAVGRFLDTTDAVGRYRRERDRFEWTLPTHHPGRSFRNGGLPCRSITTRLPASTYLTGLA